jgi:MFS family permease
MQRRAPNLSAENATPGPEQEPQRRWVAIAALRHRNFRLFWGGQVVSLIGTWMQTVAQGYLVYHLTHSAAMLGVVTTLASLPVLLLTLFGGVLADRLPKRRVLVGTQSSAAALALILGILVATGLVQVWHVMLLATALGVVNAIDVPTRQAFVVELVGKRDLLNAIALNSSIFNGARIVGPAVAGLLIAHTGLAAPFLLNAASYIAVIAGLLAMRLPPFMVEQDPGPALRRLASGLRYIRHDAAVSTILLVMAIAGVLAFNYPALMPAFAAEELRQGAEGLGLLYAALGVGAIVGALTLAAAGHRLPRAPLFWVGAVLFCALQIAFSFTRTLPVAMGTLVVMGLFMILFTAGANTLVQTLVPDGLRGRVMGVYTLVFLGSTPIGSLLAGLVAGRLHSVPLALAGGSALSLLAIAVVWWRRPTARALVAPQDAADQQARGPAQRAEQETASTSGGARSHSVAAR